MAKCINCEQEATDRFCSHCGQRIGVKRITFKEGWYDFWARIYGFDGMFPRTLRDLTIRPGAAARTFISGNRAKYYGPVGYFFLMITVFFLLLDFLNIDSIEFFREMGKTSFQPEIKSGSKAEAATQRIFQFVSDNWKIIFFCMIPIQAFLARFLFFRKSGFNYLENTVLPFYTAGHTYWITIVMIIIYKSTGLFLRNSIGTVLSLTYVAYAYSNLFSYQPKWKAFLKGLATYVLSLFIFILIGVSIFIGLIVLFPSVRQIFAPLK